MAKSERYYDECSEHKRVKSVIVSRYLKPWAKIVGPYANKINYLDLFSGRGKFKDKEETPATPLLIFDAIQEASLEIPWILEKLQVSFYEGRKDYFEVLEKSLKEHSIYEKLEHRPIIEKKKIDANFIFNVASKVNGPLYSFIDPFGYKGYSLEVIDNVTKDWAWDCLFYLSIAGLVRNIQIPEQEQNLRVFFGDKGYNKLRQRIEERRAISPFSELIFTDIEQILRERRKYFMAPYCVEFDDKKRPSHFLVFLSKHERGFKIMRDMMIARGFKDSYGLPLLMFSPKSMQEKAQLELALNIEAGSLNRYSKRLLRDFSGIRISFPDFSATCVQKGYLLQDAHLKIVLTYLEKIEKVKIERLDKLGRPRKDKRIFKYDYIGFPKKVV